MEDKRTKILFDIKVPPEKVIIAICQNCGKKIEQREWRSYGYIPQSKARIRDKWSKCPHCGLFFDHVGKGANKPTPKWVKVSTNEYKAVAKDGDFLVWKWGQVWKSRYRKKGVKEPLWVKTSFCIECAKGICERSKDWVV